MSHDVQDACTSTHGLLSSHLGDLQRVRPAVLALLCVGKDKHALDEHQEESARACGYCSSVWCTWLQGALLLLPDASLCAAMILRSGCNPAASDTARSSVFTETVVGEHYSLKRCHARSRLHALRFQKMAGFRRFWLLGRQQYPNLSTLLPGNEPRGLEAFSFIPQ